LLWQKRDVGLLTYFVQQMEDEAEKARAWQRYREIRRFVEARTCRHHQICSHFGEIRKWNSCGACDVCVGEPEWLSKTTPIGKATSGIDRELREYLREWRRAAAKSRCIPAYIVMHDTSLDELCRLKPRSLGELRNVIGFGEKKTELYGPLILDALVGFNRGARAARQEEERPRPASDAILLSSRAGHLKKLRRRAASS